MQRRSVMLPTIREQVAKFLSAIAVTGPPLLPEPCLDARKLQITDQSLDELLRDIGAQPPTQRKLDAMLEVRGRLVWLRQGLHSNQRKTGVLHEVGHDVLPWQREVLYYCSILDLPWAIQQEWEQEATAFAVESMFFAGLFVAEALSLPFCLATPKHLAEERYGVSFEAAFRQYVESHHRACCLLVSRPVRPEHVLLWTPADGQKYEIQYYVNSPSFRRVIRPKQAFTCPAIDRLFSFTSLEEIMEHEFVVRGHQGDVTFYAQSFTNTYRVFTLLSETPFESLRRQPGRAN